VGWGRATLRAAAPDGDARTAARRPQFAARVEARAAKLAREAVAAERAQVVETVDPETGAKRVRHGPQLADAEVESI
jgi:hypothetical protein